MKDFFKKLLDYWKIFAQKLGVVQTFIILSVIYWLFFGVFALVSKLFARDLLQKRIGNQPSFWANKSHPLSDTLTTLRRQF
ncbi:MAG: hypothetical protein ACE5HO_12270 [bacterium]